MSDVIARQIAINQNTLLFIFHIAGPLSPLLPWNNMAECLGFVGKANCNPSPPFTAAPVTNSLGLRHTAVFPLSDSKWKFIADRFCHMNNYKLGTLGFHLAVELRS